MVTCKQCQEKTNITDAGPEIDEDGIYFVCSECEHRNKLTNIAKPGDPLILTQLDD